MTFPHAFAGKCFANASCNTARKAF